MSPGPFALAFAGAFTGAALYVNLVEQPARLALDDLAMLKEWRPSDHRGFTLLAALSLVSGALGLTEFAQTHDVPWALGALASLLSWPYSFFTIVPMNNRILALSNDDAAAARELIRNWGLLEYGQTAIGAAACVLYLWGFAG